MNAEPKPLVLIVDDNPQNLRVAVGVLEEVGYECAMAVSGEEVVAFAESDRPDLILLDIMIPGMDGYEICSRLKQHPATGDIPVIFLTARSDAQDVVKGFAVGAVDYVTKPFNRPELTARVAAHVELKRSRDGLKRYVSEMEAVNTELRAAYDTITQKSRQLEAAMEELELVSRTDVVTNLANRRFMQARLSEEMARYSRSGLPFSIILVDADHFKSINDTYGHDYGDLVLRTLGELLSHGLRTQDLTARWGGEEFLVLLPDTGAQGGAQVAERLRYRVEAYRFNSRVTVTLGGATVAPDKTLHTLLREADAALYAGKFAGRNCVRWYE